MTKQEVLKKMGKMEVNDKLLSAISYFSSICGEFAAYSPTQKDSLAMWSWHSNDDDALEPGYWLHISYGNEVTAKINEAHTPNRVLYQAVGYCKYHGIELVITI